MQVSIGRAVAGAGCRAWGAGVVLLVGVSARGQVAESHPWWPDPDTGLMWSQITAPRAYVDYDHAVSGCEQSFDGYSGWRLPTEDEFTPVTVTTQVMNYAITETGAPGFRSKSPDFEGGFKDLGYAEFDLKQWAPAIAALKVAAKIAKHDADEVYFLQGKMNDAKKQQKKAAQAAKQ